MKILIIGGAVFIGRKTAEMLIQKGHHVTLFHRSPLLNPISNLSGEIYGDRRNLMKYADRFRELSPDVVLDMIPMIQQDALDTVSIFEGIAGRLIAVSSQDVYRVYGKLIGIESGSEDPIPLAETAPLRTRLYPYRGPTLRDDADPGKWVDFYDKIPVETAVMGSEILPGTVLRLPMVYGPNDRQHRLFDILKRIDDKRKTIILDELIAEWRWTRGYVEDVAAAVALAVCEPAAGNRIYNVGEPDGLSMKEWTELVGKVAGWDGMVIAVPPELLPEGMQSKMDARQHLVTDTSRIRLELGFKETLTREEALLRSIEWERAHPPETYDPDRFDYAGEDQIVASLGTMD